MPFHILTVCTGNICRSPQAEALLQQQFSALAGDVNTDVTLSSAGTHALVGVGMPEQAASKLSHLGIDPTRHIARQLTIDEIDRSNLVLALAREHRSAIVKLLPRAAKYTFTLREFARIVSGVSAGDLEALQSPPAGDLQSWLTVAAAWRGYFAANPGDDDVLDPYRRSDELYDASFAQLAPAVSSITGALTRSS